MSHVQSLEGRVLFASTPAGLSADYSAVTADRVEVSATVSAEAKVVAAAGRTLAADVKGSADRAADNKLLAHADADGAKLAGALRSEAGRLTAQGTADAARARAAGDAVLRKSTPAGLARLSAAVTTLNAAVAADLSALVGDTHLTPFLDDLDALAAADPTDARLAADVPTTESDVSVTTLRVAARAFATTAASLAADVQAVATPDAAPTTGGTLVATPGSGAAGTTIVLTGTTFTAPLTITFTGGVQAAGSFTSTTATVTVPAGAQTGPITVTTAAGTFATGTFTVGG